MLLKNKRTSAASLPSRKQGFGVFIHIKTPSIFINIHYDSLLVSNRVFYINYIALASDPFWIPCYADGLLSMQERSDCGSFKEGGDLGDFGPGDMQKQFEDGTKVAIVRAQERIINSKGNIIYMYIYIYSTLFSIPC